MNRLRHLLELRSEFLRSDIVYVSLETSFRWIQSSNKQNFDACSGSLIFLSTRLSLSLFKRSVLVLQNHFERIIGFQIINQLFFVSTNEPTVPDETCCVVYQPSFFFRSLSRSGITFVYSCIDSWGRNMANQRKKEEK